jgi:RNA polymerase sigma-70 factor (ECF subfamily)
MEPTVDDARPSRSSGHPPPGPDDRELVARALGDVDAFAELYRRHVTDVHAFVTRRCGSSTLADDVTAAAFERALRNLRTFEWRAGGFRAWVFRIAANELVDHHRREMAAQRRVQRVAAAHVPMAVDPAQHVIDLAGSDDADGLRAALGALRPRYQEAISLRWLAELDPTECAAAMQVSKATFAVILHRAMRALHQQLEDAR